MHDCRTCQPDHRGWHTCARSRAADSVGICGCHTHPDERDTLVEHQTVLVEDGRITRLGPARDIAIPAGAVRVDGRGEYLIAGLGDAHAHLSTNGGGTSLAERAMLLNALNGVTMVRSLYTEIHHHAVRDRVERGDVLEPRSVLVSPALTGQNARTPQVARDNVRKFHADVYQFVKVLGGLSCATFDTIAAEARTLGMQIGGHVPTAVPLRVALNAGYASIEHLDG